MHTRYSRPPTRSASLSGGELARSAASAQVKRVEREVKPVVEERAFVDKHVPNANAHTHTSNAIPSSHNARATAPLSLHTLAHSNALQCAVIWIGIVMLAFGGFVAINELVLKTGSSPVIDLAAGALGAGSNKILINLPTTRAELVATVTDKQNDIDTYAWVMSEATKNAFTITGFQSEEFIKSPATASTWIDFGAAAVPGTFSFILTVKDSKS